MLILILLAVFSAVGITISVKLSNNEKDNVSAVVCNWFLSLALVTTFGVLSVYAIYKNCRLERNAELYNLETAHYQYIIDNKVYEDDVLSTEYRHFMDMVMTRNVQLRRDKLDQKSIWIGIFIPKNINEYKEVILR